MKTRFLFPLLTLLLAIAAARADDTAPAISWTGHYLLIEHVMNIDALDAIDFHPDGTCAVDYTGATAIPASYKIDGARLTITLPAGAPTFVYGFTRRNMSLTLTKYNADDLHYDLLPTTPSPVTFNDVIGIYYSRDPLGDCSVQITPDHHFHMHVRNFYSEDHTYYDVDAYGKCTFANGIVTYLPDHATGPQQDLFIKDVLVKHDAKGLWVIDAFDDVLLNETPAKDLNFPPPPAGYKPGAQ